MKRSAGILMHITSLPSPFGVGDLGPNAFRFADFLMKANQTYWQILPLSPITSQQAWSPYSSLSGMAGNVLLISPEMLVKDGLLTKLDIVSLKSSEGKLNYTRVSKAKLQLLKKAYTNSDAKLSNEFDDFCKKESHWLDDFALFSALRTEHDEQPWHSWPKEYRTRKIKSLQSFSDEHKNELRQEKWNQFIFFRQWHALKKYCNNGGVKIIGDLPFYVSYDSADVWARQEIFKLDSKGKMLGVAGVPPDYFNDEGQLWGMPVYRWDVLKENNYDWWISRLKKNLELTDVLRLDHFRAFENYWEVPAKNKNAIKGKWRQGPGEHFFQALKRELGELPFIAEDLGDVDQNVYRLRDKFRLPGMKVLQFAFGDNMPESDHIPHQFTQNFVAYSGTHDNNTSRGWFRKELKSADHKRLSAYTQQNINEKNVADTLINMAYASVADTCIIPLQDILNLSENARMNIPASVKNNWSWRLESLGDLYPKQMKLKTLVSTFDRLRNS